MPPSAPTGSSWTAAHGEEALRLIDELRPDIAIFDVHMPRLTGLQAARKLIEKQSSVKVILLTMHEDEDLVNEARNLGIQAYVLKENAVEDLVNAIRSVAEGRSFISPTPTERRVLQLIADDKTSKEITEIVGCAVRTFDTRRQNMSAKLEPSGSHSLLKFASDNKSRL